MKIAGIDYSMTCPCITIGDSDNFRFDTCEIHYLTNAIRYDGHFQNVHGTYYNPPECQIERFIGISHWAYCLVKNCKQILIEDYSMGSKGKVFHIAENTAMLKYQLHVNGKTWAALPPTSLKKYAYGKGNADKVMMCDAFKKDTHINLRSIIPYTAKKYGSPLSDIVDSYYLAKHLVQHPLE